MRDKFIKGFFWLEKKLYEGGLLRPDSRRVPNFLGIGAAKAGTTWLYYNLVRHGEVEFSRRIIDGKLTTEGPRYQKELRYFRGNERFLTSPFGRYLRHFEGIPHDSIKGEISPAYMTLAVDRIRFLRRVFPNLKLILLVRDPVERAWSQAKMDLVQRGSKKMDEVTDEEWIRHLRQPGVVRQGSYKLVLDRYLAAFPQRQLFVGFFDDIMASPEELYANILRFLGARVPQDLSDFPLKERVGAGLSRSAPPRVLETLYELHEPGIREFAAAYAPRALAWLGRNVGASS